METKLAIVPEDTQGKPHCFQKLCREDALLLLMNLRHTFPLTGVHVDLHIKIRIDGFSLSAAVTGHVPLGSKEREEIREHLIAGWREHAPLLPAPEESFQVFGILDARAKVAPGSVPGKNVFTSHFHPNQSHKETSTLSPSLKRKITEDLERDHAPFWTPLGISILPFGEPSNPIVLVHLRAAILVDPENPLTTQAYKEKFNLWVHEKSKLHGVFIVPEMESHELELINRLSSLASPTRVLTQEHQALVKDVRRNLQYPNAPDVPDEVRNPLGSERELYRNDRAIHTVLIDSGVIGGVTRSSQTDAVGIREENGETILTVYFLDTAGLLEEKGKAVPYAYKRGIPFFNGDGDSNIFARSLVSENLSFRKGKESPAIGVEYRITSQGDVVELEPFLARITPKETLSMQNFAGLGEGWDERFLDAARAVDEHVGGRQRLNGEAAIQGETLMHALNEALRFSVSRWMTEQFPHSPIVFKEQRERCRALTHLLTDEMIEVAGINGEDLKDPETLRRKLQSVHEKRLWYLFKDVADRALGRVSRGLNPSDWEPRLVRPYADFKPHKADGVWNAFRLREAILRAPCHAKRGDALRIAERVDKAAKREPALEFLIRRLMAIEVALSRPLGEEFRGTVQRVRDGALHVDCQDLGVGWVSVPPPEEIIPELLVGQEIRFTLAGYSLDSGRFEGAFLCLARAPMESNPQQRGEGDKFSSLEVNPRFSSRR